MTNSNALSKIQLKLEDSNWIRITSSVSIFLLFFITFYIRKDNVNVSNISYSQILTAMEWLNGNFIWLGAEVPYEKHYLPGPLIYLLLMPPLLISKAPYASSIIWLIIWISMTFTTAFFFVKTICRDKITPYLFLLLLVTSPYLFYEFWTSIYWNKIFSLFFHLLTLIFIYKWQEKKSDIYLCLLGAAIGLGVQIHYSLLFHLIPIITLFITDERVQNSLFLFKKTDFDKPLQSKPFQWKYLSAFFMFLFLPQIPYLTALTSPEISIPKPDFYRLIWLMQDFFSNPLKRFEKITDFMDIKTTRWIIILPIVSLLYLYKSIKKEKNYVDESLITLSITLIGSFLIGIIYSDSVFFIGLFALILAVKWQDGLWTQNESGKFLLLYIYALFLNFGLWKEILVNFPIFLILGFITFFLLHAFYWKQQNIIGQILISITIALFSIFGALENRYGGKTSNLKKALSFIYSQTGWSTETAMNHIFGINIKSNISFAFPYQLGIEEIKDKKPNIKKQAGFFIINSKKSTKENIEDYLLSKKVGLPREIKAEILNKNLKITSINKTKDYWLAGWTITKNSMFPSFFHNTSTLNNTTTYTFPDWFKESCYFSGVFKKKDTIYFCWLFNNYLETIGISIKFGQKNNDIFIDIIGPPLTLVDSDRVILHHHIKDLNLELFCNKKAGNKKEIVNLLSQIGLDDNAKKIRFHKSFFAPLKLKKTVRCELEKITKINISFEHQRGWENRNSKFFSLDLTKKAMFLTPTPPHF